MTPKAMLGVPYSQEMIDNALTDLRAQVDPDSDDAEGVETRYPKAQIRDFDGNPNMISEMDALVAYLQILGTLVDFETYDAKANER